MFERRYDLVELRKSRNWLQKDVVRELKSRYGISITESYYGMIEQGVRTPKLNVALSIANLFDSLPEKIFFANKPNKILSLD